MGPEFSHMMALDRFWESKHLSRHRRHRYVSPGAITLSNSFSTWNVFTTSYWFPSRLSAPDFCRVDILRRQMAAQLQTSWANESTKWLSAWSDKSRPDIFRPTFLDPHFLTETLLDRKTFPDRHFSTRGHFLTRTFLDQVCKIMANLSLVRLIIIFVSIPIKKGILGSPPWIIRTFGSRS